MPLIRDSRTKPIRCTGHVWADVEVARCPNCGLVNDRTTYGFVFQGNHSATPLGSPRLQPPQVKGITNIKAGNSALPVGVTVVQPGKTPRNGWIPENLGKNTAKRPSNV